MAIQPCAKSARILCRSLNQLGFWRFSLLFLDCDDPLARELLENDGLKIVILRNDRYIVNWQIDQTVFFPGLQIKFIYRNYFDWITIDQNLVRLVDGYDYSFAEVKKTERRNKPVYFPFLIIAIHFITNLNCKIFFIQLEYKITFRVTIWKVSAKLK